MPNKNIYPDLGEPANYEKSINERKPKKNNSSSDKEKNKDKK